MLFDGTGELARKVGSMALPTTLFYNAEGRLVGSHLGELSRASLRHAPAHTALAHTALAHTAVAPG